MNEEVDWFKSRSGFMPRESRGFRERLMQYLGVAMYIGLGAFFVVDFLGGIDGPLGRMLLLGEIRDLIKQVMEMIVQVLS